MYLNKILISLVFFLLSINSYSEILSVSAQYAYEATQKFPKKNLLIDVRSPSEIFIQGAPVGIKKNIPYKVINKERFVSGNYAYEINEVFNSQVSDFFYYLDGEQENMNIFVLCTREDNDCAKASRIIKKDFEGKVSIIKDGFIGIWSKYSGSGWLGSRLPITYTVKKNVLTVEY